MAPRKTARRHKRRRTRQQGKFRKGRKTVRGHRHSTTGTLYPPLDVRTPNDVKEILKRITKGPVTVVLVYADWCGHCHTLMPHFKAASQLPGRNAQVISIHHDKLDQYNKVIKGINSSAPELNVEGYPSVLLVGSDGTKLSEIASTKEALNSAMVNVAPVAVEAGLAKPNSIVSLSNRRIPSPRTESPENVVRNIAENEIVSTRRNSVNKSVKNSSITMEEIGMEPTGLATKQPSFEHLNDNDNIINQGEEDIGVAPAISTNRMSTNRMSTSTRRISGVNVPRSAIANTITAKEAEEITSLRAPLSNETTSSLVVPSQISDTRTIRTGGNRGGSLYGIMSQSAYRLAPAAVLLATAAAVMKPTHRRKRNKTRRTRR